MKLKLGLVCLLVVASLSIVFMQSSKLAKEGAPISDPTIYVQKYGNLINEITRELHNNRIGFVLDYAIQPDETVEIQVRLPSKNIKKATEKEIEKIVTGFIKERNAYPEQFQLSITSFYEKPKNRKHSSVRLSYNDLMGHIMQRLEKENYSTFGLDYEITSEEIKLNINLPVENDTAVNPKVKQITTEIIKQNHFDTDDFKINIFNEIQTASTVQNAEVQDILEKIQDTSFTIQVEEELKKNGFHPNGFMGVQIYSKDKQYITIFLKDIDPEDKELNLEVQRIVDMISQANGLGSFIIDIQGS